MKQQIQLLSHQLADFKRLVYGSKRERFISSNDPAQGSLFNIPQQEEAQEQTQQITYQRRKPKSKKQALRLELPSHLPRREEVIIPENLPEGAIRIGEAVTELLDYVPGKLEVRRIVRPKFIIGSNDEKTNIVIADLPSLPIPRGNATSGLLAHILISKFVDHLPFY
ncbi:MAG: IS66 family transposase, partial [Bacteroidales bacterium]|nr:IS66 family transposase [Bacteroidales bacterium]